MVKIRRGLGPSIDLVVRRRIQGWQDGRRVGTRAQDEPKRARNWSEMWVFAAYGPRRGKKQALPACFLPSERLKYAGQLFCLRYRFVCRTVESMQEMR
jgi:hypothetical protein